MGLSLEITAQDGLALVGPTVSLSVVPEGITDWQLLPPFGPVLPALTHTYPLSTTLPERFDCRAYNQAVTGLRRLVAAHPETTITVFYTGRLETVQRPVPDSVSIECVDR